VPHDTRYQNSKTELWSLPGGIMENRSSPRMFCASGQRDKTFLFLLLADGERRKGEREEGMKEGRKKESRRSFWSFAFHFAEGYIKALHVVWCSAVCCVTVGS